MRNLAKQAWSAMRRVPWLSVIGQALLTLLDGVLFVMMLVFGLLVALFWLGLLLI